MTPEQRLIEAATERALASVVYAKAKANDRGARDAKADVYQRARVAANEAYKAVIKADLGPRVKATEDALKWADEAWGIWDKEYKAALEAVTELKT